MNDVKHTGFVHAVLLGALRSLKVCNALWLLQATGAGSLVAAVKYKRDCPSGNLPIVFHMVNLCLI